MANRMGIHISGHYVVSTKNAMTFHICTLISEKLKGRTKSCFILFLKHNDHQTGYFNFGLRQIHPNGCKFELNCCCRCC